MNHKIQSRLPGEISITSDMQMTKVKMNEESEKADLKLNTQKTKIMGSGHHLMANRWGSNRNSDRLYFFGLQNHYGW